MGDDATTAIEKLQGKDLKGRKLKLESAVKKARGRNAIASKEDSPAVVEDTSAVVEDSSALKVDEVGIDEKEKEVNSNEKVIDAKVENTKKEKKSKKEKKMKTDVADKELIMNEENESKKSKKNVLINATTEVIIKDKGKNSTEKLVKETKTKKNKEEDIVSDKVAVEKLEQKKEIVEKKNTGKSSVNDYDIRYSFCSILPHLILIYSFLFYSNVSCYLLLLYLTLFYIV